ncbi:MAG: peroxiredoxin [Kangiellaceae bacterium]|nr:peroxiredoxin [Kangiellaceae bacterium]
MIQVGETIPNTVLKVMRKEGPQDIATQDIFSGKKVVLFAVPGAFTPTCSAAHLPGFVVQADAIKAKGVDSIVCMSVNDVFVMNAWGKSQNAEEIMMVADGNADFTEALGLDVDATAWGMGAVRSKRFALIANDGVVEAIEVDEKGLDKSSAEHVLTLL